VIEVSSHPDSFGAVLMHSTESGRFFACSRVEFERLAAAIKRGALDPFLMLEEGSFTADGDPDWTRRPPPAVIEGDDGLGVARLVALRMAAGKQPQPGDIETMAQALITLTAGHPVGEQA
jgi:hypothetical protein